MSFFGLKVGRNMAKKPSTVLNCLTYYMKQKEIEFLA